MEASETQQEERVKPLELFFDLVFVFGLTQVTTMISADPTWGGLLADSSSSAAIWWAWAAYAWLTNTLNPEEGIVRIAMFGVMAAMLIAALAVPEAFDEHGVDLRSRLPHRPRDASCPLFAGGTGDHDLARRRAAI